MRNFFKKRRKLKIFLLITLAGITISLFIADRYVRKYGYKNLWHYVKTYSANKSLAANARYETLEITIDENDFQKLEAVREKALKRGILIDEGGSYVKARLKHNGKKIEAKLRLKGHMLDHLGDKKWSFRIKTKKNDAFMGMKIFSLQDPGTRNYIYEWIYHRMMKEAGIVALRYDFVRVKLNGEDWGIYALEEHFSQELIQHNQRIKGPIVRFDPELYWISRINELDHISIQEEYAKMQSAFIDVYDDNSIEEDSVLFERYVQAVRMMEGFRRGRLNVSQVFDVKKLADFHAIIDLVGGHHSIDWSDIKYYYNPETNLLEPVAYESFSVNPVNALAGSYRFSTEKPPVINDWHNALFSDREFFIAYIKSVNKFSAEKWLKGFMSKTKKEMDKKLAIVYTEFPSKQLNMDGYYKNQQSIREILSFPYGLIAHFNSVKNDSLFLNIGGIDALPYEVIAVHINAKRIPLPEPKVINPKSPSACVQYKLIGIPLKKTKLDSLTLKTSIKLESRLLGNQKTSLKPVQMVSLPDKDPVQFQQTDLTRYSFLVVNPEKQVINIKRGKWTISETIVIPKNYTLVIQEGTTVNFTNRAGIISYSPIQALGSDEMPVSFTASDSVSGYITLVNAGKPSAFRYVQFTVGGAFHDKGLAAGLRIYRSEVKLENCIFSGQQFDGVRITDSKVLFKSCSFTNISASAVTLNYSTVEMTESYIRGARTAIASSGSRLFIKEMVIERISGSGVDIGEGSYFQATNLTVKQAGIGVSAHDKAVVRITGLELKGNKIGLKSFKNGDIYGPSEINVLHLKESENKTLMIKKKKSVINIVG